ncbi:MAG: iron-containing alcohol dehydrogenase, partial [Candidatus Goldbacteria bacterium]|nr:iron-containing alcohol dehydrogenase [Candidatus Goldiibacteriota bacterium]
NLKKGKTALFFDRYVRSIFIKKADTNFADEQIIFGGECCPEEFRRVFLFVKEKNIKNLIASGGGKILDLAKYIKKIIPEINLINIPTSAATCAAFTPVSVIYNKDGSYLNTLDTKPPDVLIIDYEFFMNLPFVFFAAGVMDTLAKFYETELFYKNEKNKNFFDNYTRDLANILKKNIFRIINRYRTNLKEKDKIFLTDCNIIYSGLISCVGSFTVTSSIAHALAHAMTFIPATRKYLHGEHISVTLIIQEQLLGNKKHIIEIEKIITKLDMPFKLSDIGIFEQDIDLLYEKYRQIKQREKIYIPVNDDLMYNIMKKHI